MSSTYSNLSRLNSSTSNSTLNDVSSNEMPLELLQFIRSPFILVVIHKTDTFRGFGALTSLDMLNYLL